MNLIYLLREPDRLLDPPACPLTGLRLADRLRERLLVLRRGERERDLSEKVKYF